MKMVNKMLFLSVAAVAMASGAIITNPITPAICPVMTTHAWPNNCKNVKIYTYQFMGETCYGDPYCADRVHDSTEISDRDECPHLPCPPPPPCTHPVKTYFYLPDGTKCRGCDQCPSSVPVNHQTRRGECPRLPCPLPPCKDTVPTYYNLPDGTRCRGCDQCPQ